jgi:CheY-specific phosphatase CheX
MRVFVAELGNMIIGKLATNASQNELIMDIIPATVLVGEQS